MKMKKRVSKAEPKWQHPGGKLREPGAEKLTETALLFTSHAKLLDDVGLEEDLD